MAHAQGTASEGFFGDRVAAHLEMPGQQIVEFREEGELALAVTRLSCGRQARERTAPVSVEAAFSILHQLDDLERHACWLGGRQRYAGAFAAGTVSVIDLRDSPQCQFTGRVEALQFYVPRAALDRLAERHGARRSPPCAGGAICRTGSSRGSRGRWSRPPPPLRPAAYWWTSCR